MASLGEHRQSPALRRKSLRDPDDTRQFAHGAGEVVRIGTVDVGRAVLHPGWRWSVDVKPLVGTASCQMRHLHVVLSGRFAVQMEDGALHELAADDVVEVPPGHDAWVLGSEPAVVLDISGNVSEFAVPASPTRVVLTMLMTDIVGSTDVASRLGDARWKRLLADHNRIVRHQLDRFRGREINTTGDGFLATFDSAGAALLAGVAIAEAVHEVGIEVRVGVHTGEVELLADDLRGIAVHATARVMAAAGGSHVLTTSISRMLAAGNGLRFEELGARQFKGIETPVELFAVSQETPA